MYDFEISAIILTKDRTARSANCLTLLVYASSSFLDSPSSACINFISPCLYFHTNKKASPMFLFGEPPWEFTILWQIYAI